MKMPNFGVVVKQTLMLVAWSSSLKTVFYLMFVLQLILAVFTKFYHAYALLPLKTILTLWSDC